MRASRLKLSVAGAWPSGSPAGIAGMAVVSSALAPTSLPGGSSMQYCLRFRLYDMIGGCVEHRSRHHPICVRDDWHALPCESRHSPVMDTHLSSCGISEFREVMPTGNGTGRGAFLNGKCKITKPKLGKQACDVTQLETRCSRRLKHFLEMRQSLEVSAPSPADHSHLVSQV